MINRLVNFKPKANIKSLIFDLMNVELDVFKINNKDAANFGCYIATMFSKVIPCLHF